MMQMWEWAYPFQAMALPSCKGAPWLRKRSPEREIWLLFLYPTKTWSVGSKEIPRVVFYQMTFSSFFSCGLTYTKTGFYLSRISTLDSGVKEEKIKIKKRSSLLLGCHWEKN